MEPFVRHTGVVAPLDRVNVDTDQIIPKQFLKRIERTGFGQYLFFDWRFNEDGSANPDFVLNKPGYRDASVLVAGRNFGSGSSREHAPWALQDYGIRAVIAPSFADIFQKNCFENGIVPVILPEEQVNQIINNAEATPGYRLTVDLERCLLTDTEQEGINVSFNVHNDPDTNDFRRTQLLNGLDEIDLVMEREDDIAEFEAQRGPHGGVLTG
ncbi:MAG: 3-isopropylmalate dehydratase small subunit [SAR202 cluster bacterium]|jgi:3-isopropylmalate/(R)-2-methylmalate dehydratase small subunit|nr:3-isopropylmalate dehydratase small subunit [SAR202 cluster bacterium]